MIEAVGRRFAIAFGYGRHLLEPDVVEDDFGLKVVLNTVEPDKIRSIDARTFDDLTIHTRRDVSFGSPFGAFGFDVARDVLRAVTGPPIDPAIGDRASGADSLALLTRARFEELPLLCGRLLDAYRSDSYKDNFGFVDQLRPVKTTALIETLNDALVAALRTEQLADVHLAPPEPLDWARVEGFTYTTRSGEPDADPRVTAYLDSVDDRESITVEQLKRDKVLAVGAEGAEVVGSWSVYRALVYEIKMGDTLYALSSGRWYSVSAAYAQQVEDYVRSLPVLDIGLPTAALGVTEAAYNVTAAHAVDGLCTDRNLISIAPGSTVELCDVLTRDNRFIHVKKRGSSSTLSHLFAQGVVSAELVLRDGAFRDAARAMVAGLDSTFEDVVPAERPDPQTIEVGFVVITRSTRTTPLTLPFFSLVNLRVAAQRLTDIGYRVSVKSIREQ